MKKLVLYFWGMLLVVLASNSSYASHIVGADISYQCLGSNLYEFTLTVYRDCDGIPVQPSYKLDYSSLSCNRQGNFTVTLVSMKEISPVCAAESSTCVGGTQPGIQQYVFKGRFTIPASCTDWVFSWTDCTRNHEITNIINPQNTCLHIEARLNNQVAPCNNSPAFNNPPVSFICKGQGNFINPGTVEADGDFLSFSVITPKTGKATTVDYVAPFSSGNPLSTSSPFSIHPATGDISIFPSNDTEVSVTAILAEERRDGVVIGSVMRDIQLITRNCNNNNPILSGINNTLLDSIGVCAGDEVCFSVFGSDMDAGQEVTLTWNQPLDTAVSDFTVSGTATKPKANICWKTNGADVGLHIITITATDNFCPIVGSTTKAYKVRVYANPVVTLPADVTISCSETAELIPVVTQGQPPYIYKWNTGELTPTVVKGQGSYTVKVTDANGCFGSDNINVITGINANFDFTKVCEGSSVSFTDQSISLAGDIVGWSWNFGDPASGANNTSTSQNPSHLFSTPKNYLVTLEVTDEFGCKGSITKTVKICDIPKPDFATDDSCQLNPMYYDNLTKVKNCGIKEYILDIGGRELHFLQDVPDFPTFGSGFVDIPVETGTVMVTLTAINENGCAASITHPAYIYPKPKAMIEEASYFFDCSKPDTILHGEAVPGFGEPPYTVWWSTGEFANDIHINEPGFYTFWVQDAHGCIDNTTIVVIDPLLPILATDTICEPGEPVPFMEDSYSYWGIAKWEYAFGDGNSFTTTDITQKDPTHSYAVSNTEYLSKLIVTDASGCVDSTTHRVKLKFPDNNFVADPSPLCLGQELTLESPSGNYIDSLYWSFGNGDFRALNKEQLNETITATDTLYDYEGVYPYTSGAGNTYSVELKMYYNDKGCLRTYSKNVSVFPELKVAIDSIKGYCGDLPTSFYASQKDISSPGNTVTDWSWKFYYQQQFPPYGLSEIATSNVQNPVMTFTQNGNYFADLVATNQDGCELSLNREGFSVVNLPQPYFCTLNNCATQRTQFFYFCNSFPEVVIDSIFWDFGDGQTSNVREPFNIYAAAGTYDVTVKIFNTTFGCMEDTTITIDIYPLPIPDFKADTVCLGNETHFTDLSSPAASDNIASWSWSFGDGTFSSVQHPVHQYADTGTYDVQLVIQSEISGCTDTIIKPVVVRPVPVAGFSMIENTLVTGKPIRFIDESSGGVKWLWYFGDGDSIVITDPLNRNPEHTYNGSVKFTEITQIVYNQYNCSDTAKVSVDLNIYFLLPNGFTPNGDGKNDGFYPTYKGIESITEFKVYDRWGQLIYDGSGDLKASWDGTYKGVDQPVGVYVYYVKAIAFNYEEIVLSGKVTLFR